MKARPSFPDAVARLSPGKHGASALKNPANSIDVVTAHRRWFSDLLWKAFPSRSENEIAERAAPVLGVSARQVRNWLRGEHDPGLRYVMAVIAIAGAEVVFRRIEGRE